MIFTATITLIYLTAGVLIAVRAEDSAMRHGWRYALPDFAAAGVAFSVVGIGITRFVVQWAAP